MRYLASSTLTKLFSLPSLATFRHRNFRFLWIGAFFSFFGSWVQNVAQGWLVYDLTRDETKLALVTFASAIPVSLLGLFAGSLTDTLNKKLVLVFCQVIFAVGSLYLALATWLGFVNYWQIVIVAFLLGIVSAVETPTRQTLVGLSVPAEDRMHAITLNALAFNLSRVLGPVVGGVMLKIFGPQMCYLINGLSFSALIFAGLALKGDFAWNESEKQPIRDLLFEGMLYTFREKTLRVLFLMETAMSMFGMFYISLMPAIAVKMLGLDKQGLGQALSCIGVGAILALLMLLWVGNRPIRAKLPSFSMLGFALALVGLSLSKHPWAAFPMLMVLGFSSIMQFNSTNSLFQSLSPDRLRGRVIAMHIWAISGLAPFGAIFFGWLSKTNSLQFALWVGGSLILCVALLGLSQSLRSIRDSRTNLG